MSKQPLDLTKTPPQQLLELQQDLQGELEHFQTSLKLLSSAKLTFQDCIDNIKQISGAKEKEELLIPLTASLYVPGRVKDNSKFLVDVGTGYYVEKDEKESQKFYELRIAKLVSNSEQINKIIAEKYELLQKVQGILQMKVQEQQEQLKKQGAIDAK